VVQTTGECKKPAAGFLLALVSPRQRYAVGANDAVRSRTVRRKCIRKGQHSCQLLRVEVAEELGVSLCLQRGAVQQNSRQHGQGLLADDDVANRKGAGRENAVTLRERIQGKSSSVRVVHHRRRCIT